ncbi:MULTISPECIES: MarR family winged helix-turn-helix transcriptional regulator [Streptacidiphilus]|uniref:MarR family winged helix-turn-helix transcriptional regulator n=1 Tax=Streptacidiphilus cavernicola TaxID=3342716 RepID=A0ABV6UZR0_9ACTN|nr:MarR family transcriptional regulator [Streptacidiphilus jeojiense]
MATPTDEVEFEQMLLSRHGLQSPGARFAGRVLDKSAYILLSRIRLQGPMSIGELSEAFDLDASTLNRQTGAAMRAGLVERIADPAGGMARKFRTTPLGEEMLERDRVQNIRSLDAVMADWTDAEIAAFAAQLRRFNAGIERLGGRVWPRPEHRAGAEPAPLPSAI